MKRFAARVGDAHSCPNEDVPELPHVGGPLTPPGAPMVLIGGKPAIVVGDKASCYGSPDTVREGAPMVLIGGVSMARKGDATVHGGVILEGHPMVIVGGAAPPTTDAEAIEDAMNIFRTSEFAKTEEGKKVLARVEELNRDGDIRFQLFMKGERGAHGVDGIAVDTFKDRDPEFIASELVHEGTHDLAGSNETIDEEMRTNTNQLDLYEERRGPGYSDDELERRRTARKNGTLRDDARSRYPNAPEH